MSVYTYVDVCVSTNGGMYMCLFVLSRARIGLIGLIGLTGQIGLIGLICLIDLIFFFFFRCRVTFTLPTSVLFIWLSTYTLAYIRVLLHLLW